MSNPVIAKLFEENERLKERISELESTAVCMYCNAVLHTKDDQAKIDMVIEHMAVCEKHPVAGLLAKIDQLKDELSSYQKEVDSPADIRELKGWIKQYEGIAIENGKLKADKRELVDKYHELLFSVATKFPNETRHQTALRYINEKENYCDTGSVKTAVAKHKEGLS
jgi:hypothetical protein